MLISVAATVGLLVWVMVAGAGPAAHVFWRTPSVALVIGGAVLTTMVAWPGGGFRAFVAVVRNALMVRIRPASDAIITLVALAEVARREGMLALEKPSKGLKDDFLKRTLQMAIDGYDPTLIRTVMQTELESIELRHTQGKGVLETMGRSAPVFGMIGTLIGLVIMLGRLEDPAQIGPGMAVALLTTLYGLVVAHVFCLPLARRLSHRSTEELLGKALMLEGVLAIQAGDHPRVVAQKLRAFMPAHQWGRHVPRTVSERLMAGSQQPQQETQKKDESSGNAALDAAARLVDAA